MGVSRRQMLIASGIVGAAVAVPVAQHVGWGMRRFNADGPQLRSPRPGSWSNWAGNQTATPNAIAAPGSEAELADLMKSAVLPLRPVGSGHSWTGLAPSEGTIVDVSRFAGLIDHDAEARTATLGAGTRLRAACRELSEAGLAFSNLPDIDVQTLAGLFSTATHGTGRDLPPLHDAIVGFRLATPSGELIDVTGQSHLDLFGAGRVSLGALGIITRYTLRLERAFNLRRRTWLEPIDQLLERTDELFNTHRNFEFLYFPNTGYAAAIAHDLHEGPVTGRGPSEDDQILADLRELRDVFGWQPWLRERVFAGAAPKGVVEDFTDESWKLLSTPRPTKFIETEYHVPKERGVEAFRTVVAEIEKRREFYFPTEFRMVATDDAWLSPFNDGPRVSLAFHTPMDEDFSMHSEVFEPLLRRFGGRPHWGKMHGLTHADLRQLYPRFDEFNALRSEFDPQGKMLNAHLRGIFGVAG